MTAIRKYLPLLITTLLFTANSFAATDENKTIYSVAKFSKSTNPLLKIVKHKSTVGIIPYYTISDNIYIFLGQEGAGARNEAAGKFSDFGGTANPDGNTVLAHAVREFTEETMGQLKLRQEDVLKNGYLLYKQSEKNRDIYYIFVRLSTTQYKQSKKIHIPTVRLKASSVPNSYLAKDHFAWLSLDELMQQVKPDTQETQRFVIQTPEGNSLNILIRGFFLKDCLQNPELPGLLQQLHKQ